VTDQRKLTVADGVTLPIDAAEGEGEGCTEEDWAQSQASPNALADANHISVLHRLASGKSFPLDKVETEAVEYAIAALHAQSAAPVPLTVTDEVVEAAYTAYPNGQVWHRDTAYPNGQVWHRDGLHRAIEAAFIASRGKAEQK